MTAVTTPETLDFLGAPARVLASGGALGLVEMELPPGDMPPLHLHRDEDEGFYVLAGELTLYGPGTSVTLRPGEFELAPRCVPHAYEAGPDGARVLVMSAPGGFERFVAAVGALAQLSPEILGGVAAAHGIEILGPPGARP
jgi:quercetin dioxygenase-like cupin family protein